MFSLISSLIGSQNLIMGAIFVLTGILVGRVRPSGQDCQRIVTMGTAPSRDLVGGDSWGPTLPSGAKRTVLITGGNAGLGFESARQLLLHGFRVIIACRSAHRAEAAKMELVSATRSTDVSTAELDVSSLASVNRFADEVINESSEDHHSTLCALMRRDVDNAT
jgi:hypothetical protein